MELSIVSIIGLISIAALALWWVLWLLITAISAYKFVHTDDVKNEQVRFAKAAGSMIMFKLTGFLFIAASVATTVSIIVDAIVSSN